MYVEGRVLTTKGEPIADAIIDTWETDHNGIDRFYVCHHVLRHLSGQYDVEYGDGTRRDCRGRLHTTKDGSFEYRAIVPRPYAIPCDVRTERSTYLSN